MNNNADIKPKKTPLVETLVTKYPLHTAVGCSFIGALAALVVYDLVKTQITKKK